MNLKTFLHTIKIIVLALVIAIGVNAVSAEYLPVPPGGPTSGQPPAPINVGSTPQGRIGALGIGKALSSTFPTSGVMLDVFGALNTTSLLTFGNANVYGNLTTNNLAISNLSSTTPQALCVDTAGQVVICGVSASSLHTDIYTASGSWTVPANVYFFRVDVVGGGGSGALNGSVSNGTSGGASTFSGQGASITANGGTGGTTTGGTGGTATGGDINIVGVNGANTSGVVICGDVAYPKVVACTNGGNGGSNGGRNTTIYGGIGGEGGTGSFGQQSGGTTGFLDKLKQIFLVQKVYADISGGCGTEPDGYLFYASGTGGTNYGAGGGGVGSVKCAQTPSVPSVNNSGGGGGGGYASKTIIVPSTGSRVYNFTVGTGGSAASVGYVGGSTGHSAGSSGAGSSGVVVITYQQ